MLEKIQIWLGRLLFVLMIIIYTWMLFFKEDPPETTQSPYARDRFIEITKPLTRHLFH